LKKIRESTGSLVITGGEPLLHTEAKRVMADLPGLGFREVVLTTNGYYLDGCLDEIAPAITTLVVSVDTLDEKKADAFYGKGAGTFGRIRKNLERAAALPNRRFGITISSVVTSKNIGDLYDVYTFAKERGFMFAAAPRLMGVKAEPALVDNKEYRKFYDFLIGKKKNGGRIFGARRYLAAIRDLRKFSCRPFTMLVVSPLGEVFYPCLEIGNLVGDIRNFPTLHAARKEGMAKFGPEPVCDNRCHSACALGFGLLFDNPLRYLSEWGLIR